uniref:Ig-like domain-containing protein n=1 Tax=Neogobius melanostomus TaxID=47308 RepID=A0A8C6U9S0_9GOBI
MCVDQEVTHNNMDVVFPTGLFRVEVDKDSYTSEFRGEVVMGCSFQPPSPAALSGIRVTWHWITPGGHVREVYRLDNGVEQITSQHPDYVGRARLLNEELKRGWAKLQVSNLRISDSGKYQCFVQTGDGADYKIMTLSIFAPFKTIDKRIEKVPGREELMLTCQSEGFPQPEVMWHNNGQQLKSKPITTTATTEDQLLEITTQINVTSLEKKTTPAVSQNTLLHLKFQVITICNQEVYENGNTLTILIIVLCICRHKGTSILLSIILSHLHRQSVMKLPNRDALLLIGSTGNGKTTLARRLVSLWTQPVSNFPDFSHLQLVVYVDGNKTNGTLFDEIMAQLSLEELLSEDDLRNMLTDETLLMVDGYEEGNLLFDESLQRFLLDRTRCRVLITSSHEHSKMKEIVGTEAIVRVQWQNQRSSTV